MSSSQIDPVTALIHHPYAPPAGFAAPQPGIFKASTVIFPNVAAMRSPELERQVRLHLRAARHADHLPARRTAVRAGRRFAVPAGAQRPGGHRHGRTGACCRTGDEVLIPDNAYGPNKALAEGELAAWGITHRLYDAMDPADLAAKISARTTAGLAGGPGLGHHGVSRPARTRARVPRPRRHDRAGQHLGRRPGLPAV